MANFLKSLFIKGVEIDTTGASTGNVLSYNGTKFAPAAPGSGSLALDDLSDVVVTSPEEFQGISYNGTSWVNGYIPLVSYVRNAETTTLTTGTCVYLYGSTGDHATVKRADNTSDTTSSKTIGVVGASITASNNGPVITRGYVDGIDLSTGYTAGDVLWLGTNGAFTKTKPTAPNHLVFIGVVVRATNNGIIYVATQNGYELDEIHNVSLPNPQSGEFLKYNGSLWVADAIDLGTDTTGSYVASLVAGTGISLANNSGEGATPTITNTGVTSINTTLTGAVTGIVTTADTGTVTSAMIADGTIVNGDINASAGIALSKLASGTSGQVVIANGTGVPTYTTISGDITISSTGVATIAANSVALGTDTTGNYMSGISGTSPVSVSHTPSEGSSATVSLASGYGDTQNPYASKTANYFLASPNGASGAPTFRAIVAADIPTLNQSTTGSAAKWTTARTITLGGDLTGSVSIDGSADATLTATVAANAVALGTDTTGNYVGTITAGSGLSSTGATTGEGIDHSLSLATAYGDTVNPYASKTANFFLAAPNGSAGVPTFRAVVAADIPTLNQSTTGNAATATTLQTSRNINGVAFNGSADITVTAAAGTLTGTTLASGVTASSLTSVGTLSSLTITGDLTVDTNTLRVDSTNNRVGVNVTSPAHALDVIGRVETRAAATQDGVAIAGRAGGTSSFDVTITPTTLGADRTFTLPNVSGTAITTGNLTDITTVGTLSAGSIPATLLTGTVASARISGSYTGITAVGTLTSLTTSGTLTYSLGSLSTTSGTAVTAWTTSATTSNADYLDLRLIRTSTGSDWTSAVYRIQRLVDATRMGYIQFSNSQGVEIGYNNTSYLHVHGTNGLIYADLPISSTQSFSATNSGNQNNYVALGTGSIGSNATLFGYTAYANLRTTCGYNVGISWISTGAASPNGFTPNAHAVFLAAGGTVSGDIRSNANNATSYNTSSDYRLKRDVVDIEDGIARIRMLKPKRFKFIDDPADTVFDGFLAHEVEDIVPVAVSGAKDAVGENGHPMYQQIDTSWMVALLTAGIKELDAKVVELQARIAVLESN